MAVRAGEVLMKNGAEIYRVEDTITHICKAARIAHVETFATPTGIFASIGSGGKEGEVDTYIKAIRTRTTNLNRISMINNLSRSFTRGEVSVEEGIEKIDRIENSKSMPFKFRVFGAGMCSCLFTYMFGGSYTEALFGFLAGALCYLLSVFLDRHNVNFFIGGFCCCALNGLIALTLKETGLIPNHHFMIIGVLMLFVPGAAITNALRDLINGDTLSGIARTAEAIAVAISLASGVGSVLKLWSYLMELF